MMETHEIAFRNSWMPRREYRLRYQKSIIENDGRAPPDLLDPCAPPPRWYEIPPVEELAKLDEEEGLDAQSVLYMRAAADCNRNNDPPPPPPSGPSDVFRCDRDRSWDPEWKRSWRHNPYNPKPVNSEFKDRVYKGVQFFQNHQLDRALKRDKKFQKYQGLKEYQRQYFDYKMMFQGEKRQYRADTGYHHNFDSDSDGSNDGENPFGTSGANWPPKIDEETESDNNESSGSEPFSTEVYMALNKNMSTNAKFNNHTCLVIDTMANVNERVSQRRPST